MNLPIIILKTVGVVAVGSSAVLGCWFVVMLFWPPKPCAVRPGNITNCKNPVVIAEGELPPKVFVDHFYNHFHMVVRFLHFLGNLLNRYGFVRTKDYVLNLSLIVSDVYFDMVAHSVKKCKQPNEKS